jgi:hypothetical protein
MKTRMPIFRVTCVAAGLLLANTSSAFDMGNEKKCIQMDGRQQ